MESVQEESKVEIPSATQFKARSALLFLFRVPRECVYFVITRGSWDGNCSVEQDRLRQKSTAVVAPPSFSFGASVDCR